MGLCVKASCFEELSRFDAVSCAWSKVSGHAERRGRHCSIYARLREQPSYTMPDSSMFTESGDTPMKIPQASRMHDTDSSCLCSQSFPALGRRRASLRQIRLDQESTAGTEFRSSRLDRSFLEPGPLWLSWTYR